MDEYKMDFDYEHSNVSDLSSFVKYCIDDIYPEQKKEVYNVTTLYLGSMMDRTYMTGESSTLFSFMEMVTTEDNPGLQVAFVTNKKSDKVVEIIFDVSFNAGDDIDSAMDELREDYMAQTNSLDVSAFDEMHKMAQLASDWRMQSEYEVGYDDTKKEFEATFASLLYAASKLYE
jgi:hypothetical protein